MRIIISDIFGLTEPLSEFAEQFNGETVILDPYQGVQQGFANEKQAYQYFMDKVGIEKYSQLITDKLSCDNRVVEVIAFSVGASAMWLAAEQLTEKQVSKVQLFYGSQIRYSLAVIPSIPVHIVLPQSEPHFSVKDLAESLAQLTKVSVEFSNGLHGFMNQCSDNFNPPEYQKYLAKLTS